MWLPAVVATLGLRAGGLAVRFAGSVSTLQANCLGLETMAPRFELLRRALCLLLKLLGDTAHINHLVGLQYLRARLL